MYDYFYRKRNTMYHYSSTTILTRYLFRGRGPTMIGHTETITVNVDIYHLQEAE